MASGFETKAKEQKFIAAELRGIKTAEDFRSFVADLTDKFYDGNYNNAESAVLAAFESVKKKIGSKGLWDFVKDHFYSNAFVEKVVDFLVEEERAGKKCVAAALEYVENMDIPPERRALVARIVGKWGDEKDIAVLEEQRAFLLQLMKTDPTAWEGQELAVDGIDYALTLAKKEPVKEKKKAKA